MRHELKLIIIWLVLLLLIRVSIFFPHRDIVPVALLNVSLQLLLCIICVDITVHSYKDQKSVYAHFALFFGFSFLLFVSSFVGTSLFQSSAYSSLYYHVYVNKLGMSLMILFSIVYALLDYFASSFKIILKYAASLSITLLILIPLYFPFVFHPFQLYYQQEYITLQKMNDASQAFMQQFAKPPTNNELAEFMISKNNTDNEHNKVEFANIKNAVEELRPYMNEGGDTTIFWKPLDLNSIYINAIILLFLIIFFVANYLLNKPHSAYIDKILILFFALCFLEIVHLIGYISSSTLAGYRAIFSFAQYITIICLVLMVYAFDLRLQFVLSATGKYYEEIVLTSPEKITRWRDELDNIILKSFFNIRKYNKHLGHFTHKQ